MLRVATIVKQLRVGNLRAATVIIYNSFGMQCARPREEETWKMHAWVWRSVWERCGGRPFYVVNEPTDGGERKKRERERNGGRMGR